MKREHTLATKNVKKETRNDKRNYINELASKAEDAMARNDTKTVYNITRQLAGRKTNTTKPVKDKDGKIITSLKQQLERWKDHFPELLNGEWCTRQRPSL